MRPGTLDRLGFSAANLWQVNKGLVIGRISGYGQTGPYASKPGFGTLAEGMSGFTKSSAHPGGPPTNPPIPLADLVSGVHLAFGVMVALRGQKRGEKGGQEIDLSLYEPLFGFMGGDFLVYALTGKSPEPMGNETHFTAPRNSYQTKDGHWVALSASAQAPYERMMDLVGHPELKTKPGFRNNAERIQKESRAVLNRVIWDWIRSKTLAEVLEECDQGRVTIGPIYDMEGIAKDPQVKARGSIKEVFDPALERTFPIPEIALRMSNTPGEIRFPGLPMGSANEVVYQDLLHYAPQEVAEMKAKGAI
jgi:crotonobetainyl-CoA:carnitine CoA-transferase CaiB-like acyl-CoA transferase